MDFPVFRWLKLSWRRQRVRAEGIVGAPAPKRRATARRPTRFPALAFGMGKPGHAQFFLTFAVTFLQF